MENLESLVLMGSGRQSLKNIIAIKKDLNPRFSYSSLSKSIGLKSRSYLSEVIKGKKKINEKYIHPLVDLLELESDASDLLKNKLLVEIVGISAKEEERIRGEIMVSEKNFALKHLDSDGIEDLNTILTLSIVLHFFPERSATWGEILRLFPPERMQVIDRTITCLSRLGLFIQKDERYTLSTELQSTLHLHPESVRKIEIDYLKSSIKEALEHVSDDRKESNSSIFHSGVVAANFSEFQNSLGSVTLNIRGMQSQMVSPHGGDSLLRFNIQVYPILQRKKAPPKPS